MENTELIIPAPSDPLKKHKSHFSKIGLFYFCGAIIISGVQISVITLIQLIAPQLMVNPNISLIISSLSMYLIAMPLLVIIVLYCPVDDEFSENIFFDDGSADHHKEKCCERRQSGKNVLDRVVYEISF